MRFGLVGRFAGPVPETNAERFALIEEAEELGFGAFWLNEEHFQDYARLGASPLVIGAAIAARTKRMRIGTAVILLPLHQPVDLAEQLATLDVISGGRLIVGLGLGYRDAENEAMGVDPRERVGRFEEGLQALDRLWSGEPVDLRGKYFPLRGVRISMPPAQRPRPPVWLAANTDVGVRRAARLGDAWLMNPHTTLDALARQVALFRETRRAAGERQSFCA